MSEMLTRPQVTRPRPQCAKQRPRSKISAPCPRSNQGRVCPGQHKPYILRHCYITVWMSVCVFVCCLSVSHNIYITFMQQKSHLKTAFKVTGQGQMHPVSAGLQNRTYLVVLTRAFRSRCNKQFLSYGKFSTKIILKTCSFQDQRSRSNVTKT